MEKVAEGDVPFPLSGLSGLGGLADVGLLKAISVRSLTPRWDDDCARYRQ